ncbi:MAG: alkaline phosphatase [Deltaproteobacteria bacterium]|nr:MAG: alkaline phosphatase [Deltaproteobacteria bacterium]
MEQAHGIGTSGAARVAALALGLALLSACRVADLPPPDAGRDVEDVAIRDASDTSDTTDTSDTSDAVTDTLIVTAACAPGRPAPTVEACDGRDDDCDGVVDEGCVLLPTRARNVILFIGDGLGPEQIRAARVALGDADTPLAFEALPHQGWVRTAAANDPVTDSAAASTAMATGYKANKYVVSLSRPGDGSPRETALELLSRLGRRAGLVTTHTPVTDATPAGFGAHAEARSDGDAIAHALVAGSRPAVLIGQGGAGMTPTLASDHGYTVVTRGADLGALDPGSVSRLSAQLDAGDEPPLATSFEVALGIVSQGDGGFFLLVETEQTDESGHANDLAGVVAGVADLDGAVRAALAWAADRDDTLIVVTADHETGGLVVTDPDPAPGQLPEHQYTTTGHTGADVRIFAVGPGADAVVGIHENTFLFDVLTGLERADLPTAPSGYRQAVLREATPDLPSGATALEVDGDAPTGSGLAVQSLLRFEDLFGSGAGQVPDDAYVVSALLELHARDGGDGLAAYALRAPWEESATWSSFSGDGVGPGTDEAEGLPDAVTGRVDPSGVLTLDVTDRVRAWQRGAANHGWALLPNGPDGVDLDGAGGPAPPRLVVRYARLP